MLKLGPLLSAESTPLTRDIRKITTDFQHGFRRISVDVPGSEL
jgi:hypothetical protein